MNTQSQAYFDQARFINVQSWQFEESHNYYSLMKYIESLVNTYSRLLTIRIDLSFQVGTQGQYDAEYARSCLQRLLNNSRSNRIFDNMVGYVWALEHAPERGFHYHFIFFYNGHKSQQDVTIGHEIGKYWVNSITNGTGYYFCSNANKGELERMGLPVGIGMVSRNDPAQLQSMRWMATYLLKGAGEGEPTLRSVLQESLGRFRTFGRGEIM